MNSIKGFLANEIFKDIRFWIVFFFILRLYGITNPPIEVAHNWRQTTVTMAARNFYEVNSNIMYPRVDFAGDKTGITGMEFPFLNYIIYLFSLVFGYDHWYGRLINLIFSSIGILYFFKIIQKYFTEKEAFNSSLILLTSIWFAYSRKIMPDTFSMSFVLMGFYYGTNYLDTGRDKFMNLILYFVFMLLGILSKLPSGFLLVLFSLFFIDRKIDITSKIIFASTTTLFLIPVGFWYFYWVPYLVERYGFWHFFMGKNLISGIIEIGQNMNDTLAHFYADAIKFTGFAVFIYGTIKSIILKDKKLILILTLCFLSFLLIIFKAGFTFSHHSYYIIPFVPVMALVCGYGITKIANKRVMMVLLFAIMLEGVINQEHDFILKEKEIAIVSLESSLDRFSKRDDLILINSGDCPTPMYFAHRKGWIAPNEQIQDVEYIRDVKAKGCKFVIILKRYLGANTDLTYEKIFDNENYAIYKL